MFVLFVKFPSRSDGVTACFLQNEPPSSLYTALVKSLQDEAIAKASINSAKPVLAPAKSYARDPKPGDLSMGRVKPL